MLGYGLDNNFDPASRIMLRDSEGIAPHVVPAFGCINHMGGGLQLSNPSQWGMTTEMQREFRKEKDYRSAQQGE